VIALLQVPPPDPENPWPWFAGILVLGIGALWWQWRKGEDAADVRDNERQAEIIALYKDRAERSEAREALLVSDARKQADVISAQSAVVKMAADLAGSAVEASKQNGEKLDDVLRLLKAMRTTPRQGQSDGKSRSARTADSD
jgi:hypothetical protein